MFSGNHEPLGRPDYDLSGFSFKKAVQSVRNVAKKVTAPVTKITEMVLKPIARPLRPIIARAAALTPIGLIAQPKLLGIKSAKSQEMFTNVQRFARIGAAAPLVIPAAIAVAPALLAKKMLIPKAGPGSEETFTETTQEPVIHTIQPAPVVAPGSGGWSGWGGGWRTGPVGIPLQPPTDSGGGGSSGGGGGGAGGGQEPTPEEAPGETSQAGVGGLNPMMVVAGIAGLILFAKFGKKGKV